MATSNYTSAEQVKETIKNNYKSLEDSVNNLVSDTDFRVATTHVGFDRVVIGLVIYGDVDKKEPVRWSSLDLSIEEDTFETGKGQQFTTNIGTIGEFSLEDSSKESRMNFYIQVGKVLGNSELLGQIKIAMIVHAAAIRELRKKWKELSEKEA